MGDCFHGRRSATSETRDLAAFDEIIIQDKIDVHVSTGTNYSAKIEGGKHVINLIKTKFENGVLILSDDNRCDFTRSYKKKRTVYTIVPSIQRIQHDCLGDLQMENTFAFDTF